MLLQAGYPYAILCRVLYFFFCVGSGLGHAAAAAALTTDRHGGPLCVKHNWVTSANVVWYGIWFLSEVLYRARI